MKIENDLGRDDIRRLVLRLAIPSMLAQFINVLYSVVDRIYIGNIPVIGETAMFQDRILLPSQKYPGDRGDGACGRRRQRTDCDADLRVCLSGRSGRLAAHEHPYGRGAG